MTPPRRILLLGGPVGPFFTHLARSLLRRGHAVERCIFNLGDRMFGLGGATPLSPAEVERRMAAPPWDVVVGFGVDRPRHADLLARFRAHGVPFLCLEEGYVRPGYVCAEWNGSHAHSPLLHPPEPAGATDAAGPPDGGFRPAFMQGFYSIFQLNVIKLGEQLGFGEWHRGRSLVAEFFRWPYSLVVRLAHRRGDEAVLQRLLDGAARFRVVALQVHDDANLIRNGDGLGQAARIDRLVAAFVVHAPADEHLLFKIHPLDAGHCDYRAMVRDAARAHGATARVHCVCDVPLGPTVKASAGLVTVNSTSGLSSLHHGVQTDILGHAFYEGPGLARHVADPAAIWREPHGVDRAAVQELMQRIHREALVPGSFSGLGGAPRRLAERIADRLAGAAAP